MHPEITLSVEGEAAAEDRAAVIAGLRSYNAQHAAAANYSALSILLRDADGKVVGGLLGETAWHWLYIEILWVSEEVRGRGYGRHLVEAAEQEAQRRGCRNAYLDTFEFQARPFYERLGYTLFGTLEDYPPGFNRYYLWKRLEAPVTQQEVQPE